MDPRWLAHYDAGVPQSIGTYPEETLAGLFARHARSRPNAIALTFKGTRLTYSEVEIAAASLARGLARVGIVARDRVALLMPNCPQFVISALALWRLGAVMHGLSPLYTEREIEEALHTVEPDCVIALTPFYGKVKAVQSRTTVRRVIATNIKEYLPPALRVLFTLLKEKKEGHRVEVAREDIWLQDLIREGASSPVTHIGAQPDDPCAILMSGGTTGTPKGALVNHRSFTICGTQIAAWLNEPLSAPGASILLPLPLFHVYGMGAFATSVVKGVPLGLVPNPRDIGDLLATIKRDRPTLLCSVPTLFSAMMNRPEVASGKFDFSSLHACFSGAAALMAETKSRFEKLSGARILEGYSLTEAVMALCVNPYRGANKIGSVGMPLPDVAVRIVDDETGLRELPVGQTGEVVFTAPQIMQGYWGNQEETAATLRIMSDGSTGLYTGDLGYLDSDGYLFLVDRKKDLIKTNGLQVWPREVEEVLASHPAVSEVGVGGVPDERKGEKVVAWIVLRPGFSADPDELRAFCKDRLAPFKIPSRIEFRSELPKTMVGKVLRRVLVAEAKAAGALRDKSAGLAKA